MLAILVDVSLTHNLRQGTESSIKVMRANSLELEKTGYERTGSNGNDAGVVWMNFYSNHSWEEVQQLRGNDTEANDNFGFAINLDSDLLVVGAPYADHRAVTQIGRASCRERGCQDV